MNLTEKVTTNKQKLERATRNVIACEEIERVATRDAAINDSASNHEKVREARSKLDGARSVRDAAQHILRVSQSDLAEEERLSKADRAIKARDRAASFYTAAPASAADVVAAALAFESALNHLQSLKSAHDAANGLATQLAKEAGVAIDIKQAPDGFVGGLVLAALSTSEIQRHDLGSWLAVVRGDEAALASEVLRRLGIAPIRHDIAYGLQVDAALRGEQLPNDTRDTMSIAERAEEYIAWFTPKKKTTEKTVNTYALANEGK